MKSKTKLFLASLLTFAIMNSNLSATAFASDTNFQSQSETSALSTVAEYDLTCSETQTFTVLDANGEVYSVTFEPLTPVSRIASGSYRITKTKPNAWTASMVITISNNVITKAGSPSVSYPGKNIISQIATRNSGTTATLKFKYMFSSNFYYDGFKAVLSGSKITAYFL